MLPWIIGSHLFVLQFGHYINLTDTVDTLVFPSSSRSCTIVLSVWLPGAPNDFLSAAAIYVAMCINSGPDARWGTNLDT